MPQGKAAGERCAQLDADDRCRLFGDPRRPSVCLSLRPSSDMCGDAPAHALRWLQRLEVQTRPDRAKSTG